MDNNRYKSRVEKARQKMLESGLEGLLVSKPENRYYLSGFQSSECTLVITREDVYLITDFRYMEAAKACCPDYEILLLDKDHDRPALLKELGFNVLGVEESVMTVAEYRKLEEALEETHLENASGLLEALRVIKDEYEIDCITRACSLADDCFEHILGFIKPGLTEWEVALEMELFFKRNGAEDLSFPTIAASGVRSSLPHGRASGKVIEKGDLLTLDFGCIVDSYCSDMTRTVGIGNLNEEQKKIYNIVLAAQTAALDKIKAGVSCKEADSYARDIIEAEGYGRYFGHGMGHGVGLEVHEAPTENPRSGEILAENMVVTIEPGIYLPDMFGVRIEDLAIVTSFGIINKVRSPKELIIL